MADFLTDARDRSPATLRPVRTQQKLTVVPSSNELSALAGLDADDIKKRFSLDLPEYLDDRNTLVYKETFGSMTANQRRSTVEAYDTLIDRAKKFNWEEYISRISAGDSLSAVEQAHMEIIKRMFENRISKLVIKKQQIIKLLGI
jgi:hypothetical protein